jgi:hypothetical protein
MDDIPITFLVSPISTPASNSYSLKASVLSPFTIRFRVVGSAKKIQSLNQPRSYEVEAKSLLLLGRSYSAANQGAYR